MFPLSNLELGSYSVIFSIPTSLTTCKSYSLAHYHISSAIRQEIFVFQNNLKNLDPSYKMELDFWDCFGGGKVHIIIIAEF